MKRKYTIALLFIIVVATFLRLWRIGTVPVSLFADELDVGYHAYSILKTGRDYSGNLMPLHFQSLAEWRTPLYLYATVPTVALWGITPLGVRMPAVFFGILSVWAMYASVRQMLLRSSFRVDDVEKISLLSAAVLAFSPWHIQYSRAAFEVTMLLSFYLYGLYYFFKAIDKKPLKDASTVSLEMKNQVAGGGQYLWISLVHFLLTPLIYSSAKLFTPILLVMLLLIWWKDIWALSKKYLIWALIAGVLVGAPTAYATLYSGGTQRFGYISVFTDPTRETEIGVARETAAHFRGETGLGLEPSIIDKVFYNKFTFWGERISANYYEPFSSEFLFIKGDLNLRHSIAEMGQLYKVEIITLILGLVYFFATFKDRKTKLFVGLWIVLGVIPSAITRDGGRHATRLIIILPPLAFLVAYGIYSFKNLKGKLGFLLVALYALLFVGNFIFYQKEYWTENPWYSERWWHSGYKEAVQYVKEHESEYDTVLITDKNEPPWIFFGAYMQYDPTRWQEVKPDANWVDTDEYGRITMIDKYLFTSPQGQLYDWKVSPDTLVLSSEKEVGINLLLEPERTPAGLTLLKTVTYPSGIPAFYLFTGAGK